LSLASSASSLALSAAMLPSKVCGADRRRCMTTSLLTVLTVGFANPTLICRSACVGSIVTTGTVISAAEVRPKGLQPAPVETKGPPLHPQQQGNSRSADQAAQPSGLRWLAGRYGSGATCQPEPAGRTEAALDQNERHDMPIIIGIAIVVCLAVILWVVLFGWPPS
jgi:hypothetical protein